MQFRNYILSICTLILLIITSCAKEKDPNADILPDITPPTVKYTKPTENAVLNSLLPINIIGTFTDNRNLKSYSLKVYNVTEAKLELNVALDLRGKSGHTINENFVKNNSGGNILEYFLASEGIDETGFNKIDTIKFFVQ